MIRWFTAVFTAITLSALAGEVAPPGLPAIAQMSDSGPRLTELIAQYKLLVSQAKRDDAQLLLPQIIKAHAQQPPRIGMMESGMDDLSRFVNDLLNSGQHHQAITIISEVPIVSPQAAVRLWEGKTWTEAELIKTGNLLLEWSKHNDFWINMYFYFRRDAKGAREALPPSEVLLGEMKQAVLADPTDGVLARRYASAVSALRMYPGTMSERMAPQQGACDWMGEVCRPKSASDYIALAEALLRGNSPAAAAQIMRAGLTAPLTEVDAQYARGRRAMMSVRYQGTDEQLIRNEMVQKLIHYLRVAKKNDEVIAVMKEHGITPSGSQAGELDKGRVEPLFERPILDASRERGEDISYWFERADYYASRGDNGSAETAYERAWALAVAKEDERKLPAGGVLGRYVHFLARNKKEAKRGYEILLERSRDFPIDLRTTLLDGYEWIRTDPEITPGNDPLIWKWLEDCTQWDRRHARMLETMLAKRDNWPQERVFTEARKRMRGQDTTRAAALADGILLAATTEKQAHRPEAAATLYRYAIQVLEEALERAEAEDGDDATRSHLQSKLADAREGLK